VPSEEDILVRSMLHPRAAAEGGPYTRMACPACGAEAVLEETGGGDPVLAPPEAAGAGLPAVAAFLEGAAAREERRRAREWLDRWGGALDLLRAERRRVPVREAPPPPRPKAGSRPAGPPPPRPEPPRSDRELPSTDEEARAILGVDARATREEIDGAFRRASLRCHPDLVAHLDEEFQKLAHGKFLRLKRAHELLTK